MFAAFAAGDRGFRGGRSLRPGPTEVARALWLRDWREHDPEDHSGPCRGDFRIWPRCGGFSARAGPTQTNRCSDRWRHDSHHGAGREPERQAQGQNIIVARGEDFARACQGKPYAGLRRRDRRRRGGSGAAAFRLRGPGGLRGGFPGSRGGRRRAVDRGPDRRIVRRARQLFDRFLSCLRVSERGREDDRARRLSPPPGKPGWMRKRTR